MERDDPSSAPESGQPAGGRELVAPGGGEGEAGAEGSEADWRSGSPPPGSNGEDF